MITKFFLTILIFFTTYVLVIFNLPHVAWAIGKVLWLEEFNKFVLTFKSTYDETVTKIPTEDELKNTYNTVQSWAIDFKEKFDLWVDYTKEKIDWFRETLSWAEDTFNEIKNWYDWAIKFVNTNSGLIEEYKEKIEYLSWITETISESWVNNIENETNSWNVN